MAAPSDDLAHLLDEAPDIVVRFDRAHRHVYASKAITRATGLPVDAFIGRTVDEIGMPRDAAAQWHAALEHVFTTGEERTIDNEVATCAGARYYQARLVPEHDEGGRVAYVIAVSRDLTAWRRSDEQQRRLAALVEASRDAIIGTDARGNITSFNRGASLLFGYAAEEIVGKAFLTLIHASGASRAEENLLLVDSGERLDPVEACMVRKDGTPVDVAVALSTIKGPDGRSVGTAAVIRDISSRKRTEEALRRRTIELDERVKAMQCVASISRMLLGVRDAFDEVGPAIVDAIAGAMLDPSLSSAELVLDGSSFRTTRWPPDVEIRTPIVVDSVERGAVAVGYREQGAFVPPFLPEEHGLLEMVADRVAETLRRRAAEDEVRRTAAYFRSVIENSRDMIAVLDAEARFQYVSPSMWRLLGYAPEELIGNRCFDRVHEDDRPDVQAMFMRVASEPTVVGSIEYRYRHADGSFRTLESTGANLVADHAVRGFVVNTRDVTDRRQLEEQYRHAKKLEAVGRLAGGVAHDFNNLLTVMMGATDTLLLDRRITGAHREDLEQIRAAAVRAATLTKQLLAFSRRQVLHPRIVDVNGIVQGLEQMLRRLIGADIEIRSSLARDVGPVRVDPGQLEQVIVNLVVNARDAMPGGGRIAITTSAIPASEAPVAVRDRANAFALLSVMDTGHGMAPEILAQVFEPFFTTREHGTGLGLATVHGIVAQSGGHIAIESTPGQGTDVRVFLPIVEAHVRPAPPPGPAPAPLREKLVLVVDDEDPLRAIVCRALTSVGYRVIDASSAERAEQLAGGVPSIDLLLTDVVLPGRSGPELAATLSQRLPGVRKLFMTGYSEAVINGGLAEGAAILEKPFTPEALIRAVRSVLEEADQRD